jgi:hypothetical protein
MKETIGCILGGFGVLCGMRAMFLSASLRLRNSHLDQQSVFDRKYESPNSFNSNFFSGANRPAVGLGCT